MPVVPITKAKSAKAPVPQVDPRYLDIAAAMMQKEGKLPDSSPPLPTPDGPRNILGAPRS